MRKIPVSALGNMKELKASLLDSAPGDRHRLYANNGSSDVLCFSGEPLGELCQ